MPEREFSPDEIDVLQLALDISGLDDRQKKLFLRIFTAARELAIEELESEAEPILVRLQHQLANAFLPSDTEIVVFAARAKRRPKKIRP